ncbi:cytochrome P450 [Glomus cerebriforme]|uniref:Cytochrome P450 n=1 Tax=Glomus cerebriforme TaxID=658196 RepID=A0A397TS82_9GLOM|nr:cytochrome P450 [Glomus cerebriforme]
MNDNNIKVVNSKKRERMNDSMNLFNSIETYFNSLIYSNSIPGLIRNYLPGFKNLSEKFRKNNKWLFYNFLEIIKQRRKEIALMKDNEPINSSDLLDILLTINTPRDANGYGFGFDNEKSMTDHEILATILDIEIGGRDPTASTFCFTVYNICKNPGVLQRLREEIVEILGNDFLRPITFEDLNKFKYLEAIIKETQRIIPLNPLIPRQSLVKTTLNGHIIEKDTPIWLHQEKLHKDKISWYEPEKFIPDRFYHNNIEAINKEKNAFIPWCDGIIRNCPGKKMALVILKCLLILLFRKYNIELVDKISPAKVMYFSMNRSFDLKVNLKKIENFY